MRESINHLYLLFAHFADPLRSSRPYANKERSQSAQSTQSEFNIFNVGVFFLVNNFCQFIRQSRQLISPALEIGLPMSHLQGRIQKTTSPLNKIPVLIGITIRPKTIKPLTVNQQTKPLNLIYEIKENSVCQFSC